MIIGMGLKEVFMVWESEGNLEKPHSEQMSAAIRVMRGMVRGNQYFRPSDSNNVTRVFEGPNMIGAHNGPSNGVSTWGGKGCLT
jgi:hypothetical protein